MRSGVSNSYGRKTSAFHPVTLAPEAHHRALELTRTSGVDVEYWPTADPKAIEGSREQRLEAYREVRDQILARIRQRFIPRGPGNE